MKYYSQYKQDQFLIEHYFKDVSSGHYVDVGAHDGVSLSNSKALEDLGWEGICFEPIPQRFEELIKNRSCKCYNYAVSDKSGTLDFLRVNGYSEMLSGLVDNYDPRHKERIMNEINVYGGNTEVIKVESKKFSEVVQFTDIDYVSIDVEGSELSVLKSIDFDKHTIKLFSVENNYNDTEVFDFLKSKKYKFFGNIGTDCFFERIS